MSNPFDPYAPTQPSYPAPAPYGTGPQAYPPRPPAYASSPQAYAAYGYHAQPFNHRAGTTSGFAVAALVLGQAFGACAG